jgi:hypothetical protein
VLLPARSGAWAAGMRLLGPEVVRFESADLGATEQTNGLCPSKGRPVVPG